jgi:hypothetical protein
LLSCAPLRCPASTDIICSSNTILRSRSCSP